MGPCEEDVGRGGSDGFLQRPRAFEPGGWFIERGELAETGGEDEAGGAVAVELVHALDLPCVVVFAVLG